MLVSYRTTPLLIHQRTSRQMAKPWYDTFLESTCLQHALPAKNHTPNIILNDSIGVRLHCIEVAGVL